MPNIVEAHNLVKRYPGSDQPAVRGVSFAILRGEIFGFLGPNGAGKTTIISMLACLLKPTSGGATVAGFDLAHQPNEIKRRIGLVPQDLALYPVLSARDNPLFFGRIYGLHGKELSRCVDDALKRMGLYERRHDVVGKYTGGMQRRLNIAAGQLHGPEILYLDEPAMGVDLQSRSVIFGDVEELNRQGMTVLYATRDREEAERLCQRVAIIDQGRIMALDTPRALQDTVGGGLIVISLPDDAPDTLDRRLRVLPGVRDITHFDHHIQLPSGRHAAGPAGGDQRL